MSRFADAARVHDWTGVFVSGTPDGEPYVVLTACHRDDNAFYELGVVRHEVTPEQLRAALPVGPPHDCSTASICWMLDFYDANGDLVDDREVTLDQARAIFGTEDGTTLDERLTLGRANHRAWVEHPVHCTGAA